MKPEQLKAAFVKDMENLSKTHDLSGFADGLTPGCVIHSPYGDFDAKGFVEQQKTMFKAFPDSKFDVHSMLVDGDTAAARYTVTATHKGEFRGIPPTGKKVKYSVMAFYRMAGDDVAEGWLLSDLYGLMQQLGAIPAPKK